MEKKYWNPYEAYREKQQKKKNLQHRYNAAHMLSALDGHVPPYYAHVGYLAEMAREGGKQAPHPESPGKRKAIETFGTHAYLVFDAFEHAQKRKNNGH